MERKNRLIDYFLPPGEGFVLESLVATTYHVDFEFVEEELLAVAFGVRSPISRLKAFRSEFERKLQKAEVSVLFDLSGCERMARLSPRIDAIPILAKKLHSKITLLMWVREGDEGNGNHDRRIRLIVGSANLTRQGFRENYECVVSLDFGGRNNTSKSLLLKAIEMVRQIAAESKSPQIIRQLAAFVSHAALLPEGAAKADDPVALVTAAEVVSTIRDSWAAISSKKPETVTVVSPFWAEGTTASEALVSLFQQLGPPSNLELVCRGALSGDGKRWLPVFDSNLAVELKKGLSCRICLRAAIPITHNHPTPEAPEEIGDETEDREIAGSLGIGNRMQLENQRALHAKLIFVDGTEGTVLYVGSSNCTRRGLGLGGPSNSEAGFVYRLSPRQRKQLAALMEFAGPAIEVQADRVPGTVQPTEGDEVLVPTFLSEVVATGSMVEVGFRDVVPPDLLLLMPIPARAGDAGYWILFKANPLNENPPETITLDLKTCQKCDERLHSCPSGPECQQIQPHVYVEARWLGQTATFPVRFDEKAQLPFILESRKPTESELIDYFLFGTEPDDWSGEASDPVDGIKGPKADAPIDTSGILAYFVRRFVQAIPGIETEIRRAGYSRAALDAVLKGPSSPLELAKRAFESLNRLPGLNEPRKTPTAVGFQLTEILAALLRTREAIPNSDLKDCFAPVITRCQEMLNQIVVQYPELKTPGFRLYQKQILGAAQ